MRSPHCGWRTKRPKSKGQRAGKRDNGKRAANAAAQNNKYYIEIYLEKTKTKTEKQRTKRAAEAKQIYIFKAHAKRKERKTKKSVSLNKETAEEERNL